MTARGRPRPAVAPAEPAELAQLRDTGPTAWLSPGERAEAERLVALTSSGDPTVAASARSALWSAGARLTTSGREVVPLADVLHELARWHRDCAAHKWVNAPCFGVAERAVRVAAGNELPPLPLSRFDEARRAEWGDLADLDA